MLKHLVSRSTKVKTTKHQGIKSNFLSLVLSGNKTGTVHSIFTNSFNLMFGEQMIHVGKLEEGLSAFGLALPPEQVETLIADSTIGNRVLLRDKQLIFYTRRQLHTLDLAELSEYDCRIPVIRTYSKELLKRFEQLPFSNKTDFLSDHCSAAFIDMFIDSSMADTNFQEKFIRHFIGRGQGLTPSGDDMLMGMLLAEKAKDGNEIWRHLLREELTTRKTTEVSEAYYQALFAGYTSSHFVELLTAVSRDDYSQWDDLIMNISNYGHTSGWDTLFGLFLYSLNQKGEMCK